MTTSYLLFRLSDAVYAVPATGVSEILPLPGLSRLDEVPKYVVGIVVLRGQVVPVIDLNIRFGRNRQAYGLEHCLVVLKGDGPAIGLIVDSAESVRDIAEEEILAASTYGLDHTDTSADFVQGIVKFGDGIVMLLQLESLLSLSERLSKQYVPSEDAPIQAFFEDHTAEQTAVFSERSRRFSQPLETQDPAGEFTLALVRMGEELFGIGLKAIREFAELRNLTVVPCCPEYVVGQMNLRGEIITVIDIAGVLGLPSPVDHARCKAVVMDIRQSATAVLVDELLDVVNLSKADLRPVPIALHGTGQQHILGVANHERSMFSVIDLSALLTNGTLAVNENP